MIIDSERLLLRPFTMNDCEDFASMNGDEKVMRYFPDILTRAESDAFLSRLIANSSAHHFHFLAAKLKATGQFIGLIGIGEIDEVTKAAIPSHPKVEIGWRLSHKYWGQGLATEGAIACIDYAWEKLKLAELVSFTTKTNIPSQGVMKKIGMEYDKGDNFLHPKLQKNHPLLPHVLYRIKNPNPL